MDRAERLAADGYGPGSPVQPILFYRPSDPFGWMSNYSRHPVRLRHPDTGEPIRYPTGEHRFQAMKAKTREAHDHVLAAETPDEAKKRGGPRGIELRDGWGSQYGTLCWYVMFEVVLTKAMQHSEIRDALAATGRTPIYEDSPTDDIWGWRTEQSYTGKNLLGRCWVGARNVLCPAT